MCHTHVKYASFTRSVIEQLYFNGLLVPRGSRKQLNCSYFNHQEVKIFFLLFLISCYSCDWQITRIVTDTQSYYHYWSKYNLFNYYAAPSSPPTGILANNGSSTSIWVTWSEVPDIDQNGVIRGFLIGYWEKRDPAGTVTYANVSESSAVQLQVGQQSDRRRKRAAGGTSYKYVLNGLKIWTEYLVRVAAYTVSLGTFSEPYLVRTDEGGNMEYVLFLSHRLERFSIECRK